MLLVNKGHYTFHELKRDHKMLSQSHDLVSRGVDLPARLISAIHTIFCVCVPQAIWLMVNAIAATIIPRVANARLNVITSARKFCLNISVNGAAPCLT